MWHCWLQGILCLVTKATSSWCKHHWTLLENTPSRLSCCNNHINNLVQTWGVKMCTDTAITSDSCPIRPLTCLCELGCLCLCETTVCACLSVCEGIGGGHLSSLAVIRYSTWYDMMIQAQLRDGVVWKMWWQGKRKTRLWSDIREGEKDKEEREWGREKGRKRMGKGGGRQGRDRRDWETVVGRGEEWCR